MATLDSTPQAALSRRSLADQVADALVKLILDDNLSDGDPLPSTAELAEHFGVSRTVVREALAALAGRGILSRSQGRECVVATPGASDITRLLQFRIRADAVEPADILEVRVALEVTAARSAAANRTEADLVQIRREMQELADAHNDAAFHRADIALHRAVAQASGNPLLALILDALVDFLRDVRIRATKNRRARGESLEGAIAQHRAVVEAIEAGDVDAAERAMQHHLESTAAEFARPAQRR